MLKRFTAGLFLLAVMCSVSWGAEYDPYNLRFWYTSPDYEAQVYGRYGNTDYNFFYQLRDVTGASRRDQVAGPQWFATVYENYYYGMRSAIYGVAVDDTYTGIYRRTMGGEMPDITIQTVGDLLDGFNFVFAEEPQPYASAWRRYVSREVYDVYPDPVESLCLVITNGSGEFNVDFGNPYARHFPFWWDFNATGSSSTSTKWWLQTFDWRKETYPTSEPIAYIYSAPNIYVRNDSAGKYELGYKVASSGDKQIITSAANSAWLYTVSGDEIYTSRDVLTWSVSESRDKVFNASGDLVYTIETDTAGDMFICGIRSVSEAVAFSGFDSDYSLTVNPSAEQAISSGSSLSANVRVRGMTPSAYGSRLGYITFRQRASLAQGYTNYREFTSIPMVIANVAEGNAAVEPLIFDMIVSDSADNIVNRIKFTWDAQSDKPDQDLGTFFMIGSRDVQYQLETRITNRTGTRYELYRYDMTGTAGGNPTYRDGYNNIMPDYWKYDLTADMYGTLPESFLLDAHSQIAPGLVTVYKNNIGSGYRTIDTQNDTTESFRLYEYSSSAPKNLRLNYRRIGGMTPIEGGNHTPESGVNVREFVMDFADVANNDDETAIELFRLTGKLPAMIGRGPLIAESRITASDYGDDADPASVSSVYINSAAVDAFRIVKAVPEGLVRMVSSDTGSDDSDDGGSTPSPDSPATSGDAAMFSTSEIVYTSLDIPLQPIAVRMRIPRSNSLIVSHWDEMDSTANARDLFNVFARYGTVWVRSEATGERDANLFTAINNKGSNLGVGASDIVRAFLYEDALYLDFIVIMADGTSVNTSRTAYVGVIKDDNVPYLVIGDGSEDGKWDLTFYVDSVTAGSSGGDIQDNTQPVQSEDNGVGQSSSGGGGCEGFGAMAGLFAVVLAGMVKGIKR
ncbi:MAG: hypothetical protein IJP86_03525 [Synergistaceae bacterium]|nr:hypothetical protein [Synergistaceae bacterium]